MTEKEFFQQVWRPYDTITIEGGSEGALLNVCFPTRSVCITMRSGIREWFRCELITKHTPHTGNPDDISIINDLQERLNAAEAKIDAQKQHILAGEERIRAYKKTLEQKDPTAEDIKKILNRLEVSLVEKKRRVENNMECIERLCEIMHDLEAKGGKE